MKDDVQQVFYDLLEYGIAQKIEPTIIYFILGFFFGDMINQAEKKEDFANEQRD